MLITDTHKLQQYAAKHRVWQGIPGIARTKRGRTFLSFYSGQTKETYGNFAAVIKSDTDTNFSEPIVVAQKTGRYRCFDPVLWIDPLERLWFIWNVMPGDEVFAAICEEPDAEELQWSEPFYIGRGIMMNKPLVLSTGEWLFPIAVWLPEMLNPMRKDGIRDDDIPGSYVYKTVDNGRTFTKMGAADVPDRLFDEHMVIEQENGALMMLVRTNYGIGVSYSYDRGNSWSPGEDSHLGGPCSRFFISKLRSGRVLLINHFDFKGRNNLTAMLSEDDGKTFPFKLLLDPRDDISYPDAVEGDDGFIYIVYDRERGDDKKALPEAYSQARELLTAKITEQDIINGAVSTEGSFLRNVACKLGELDPGDPDPYYELAKNSEENQNEKVVSSRKGESDIIFEKYDRIVFAGDSVTDMGSAIPVGERTDDNLGFGFVRMIDNMLAVWYPERMIRVTNSGISGHTSRDLLNRYDRDVVSLNPQWVSICIGINDVWRQFDAPYMMECQVLPEEYRQNIETMICAVKDSVKGVILCSPYFMEPDKDDPLRKRMDEYIDICRDLAKKYDCIFVDFQAMYDRYFQQQHPCYIAWDRVHPNQIGATLMARQFLRECGFDFSKE